MIIPSNSFWKVFKETHGAFSCSEAIALYNVLLDCPKGAYIELGTHRGKSTLVALAVLRPDFFYLVEPEFEKTIPGSDVAKTIEPFSKEFNIAYIPEYSTDFIKPNNELKYAYCMVDSGDHGEELVQAEIKLLEDKMMQGGVLAFHDYGNQFTAVARGYEQLIATGKYEPIPINWKQIFDYVRENNLEEGNNSWHERGSEEFPKFVGALRRK